LIYKCEIILIDKNRPIIKEIPNQFNRFLSIKKIDPINPDINILLSDKVKFIIFGCDFSCDFHNCIQNFIFLYLNKMIPFFVVRPFILKDPYNDDKLYHLTSFKEYHLSDFQKYCLNKIKISIQKKMFLEIPYHPSINISKVIEVQKYIMENPYINHSLNILSTNIGYSPAWLSHIFKKISGISLNEFSAKVKLCNALWSLVSTDNKIKSIALDLGYKPLYFSKKFHKLFGASPSNIRKKDFEFQLKKLNICEK